jgi:hypothetical protein
MKIKTLISKIHDKKKAGQKSIKKPNIVEDQEHDYKMWVSYSENPYISSQEYDNPKK